MTPAYQLHETGCYVERKEEYAPALVLLHMNELVSSEVPQERVIEANDDVAKGYCRKAGTSGY